MAEIVLFHHAQGLTRGVLELAESLRGAGHVVHTPDSYEGQVFDTLEAGLAYARETGFGAVVERAKTAVPDLPEGAVLAGISLGVMPAQELAQTRPGVRGAVLLESCVPASEFGDGWPDGVALQVHGMEADPIFAGEGDLDAARELVGSVPGAELYLYPGSAHLFEDSSLPTYDAEATALLTERVLAFLARLDTAD